HRRGEAHELAFEARVGGHLLVAAHRGREDRLTERRAGRTDRVAREDLAVLEHQHPAHSNATLPAATVSATRPFSRRPSTQEFDDRERKPSALTRHVPVRSRSVMLAGAPTTRRGRSRPKIAAGPADRRSSTVWSFRMPGSTSSVYRAEKAVSSPVTPNGADSNGTSFSSGLCGAWSVAIAAIEPSRTASSSAARSCSERSGGLIFRFGSSVRTASSVRHR